MELLRLSNRGGKTAAENAAATHVQGEIVVNTDATIRILPGALRELIAVFQDPSVGVASGRDVSTGGLRSAGNQGESGYVGYEMWIRSLETRIGTIIGASGCFFAIRRELYDGAFPEALSRDFASCAHRPRAWLPLGLGEQCPRTGPPGHFISDGVPEEGPHHGTRARHPPLQAPPPQSSPARWFQSDALQPQTLPVALSADAALDGGRLGPARRWAPSFTSVGRGLLCRLLILAALVWWSPDGKRLPRRSRCPAISSGRIWLA